MKAYLTSRVSLSPTVTAFRFRPEQPVRFLAGQYIEVILPHPDTDNRGDRRWFTISNAPGEPDVEIIMRLPRGRTSSYKQHLKTLELSDQVDLGNVLGDFVPPKDKRAPLIFVADGIGLTPFISIVRDLERKHEARDIHLFHGVKTPADQLFYDAFKRYGVTMHAHSMPLDGYRVPEELAASLPTHSKHTLYYLAGTQAYCEVLVEYLRHEGVQHQRVALDYFSGYPEA